MILLWSIEHVEFESVWIGHSTKPMDKNKHKRGELRCAALMIGK